MGIQSIDTLEVECDKCGETIDICTTVFSGNSAHSNMYGIDYEDLVDQGWTWDGDETYCKECSKESEDRDE